jgi:type IV secretion system protein VirB9
MKATTLILTASVIALSGCSTLSAKRAPDFKLDDVRLQPAVIQTVETDAMDGDAQPQTIIVERFTPVPLPGQLKPREAFSATAQIESKLHAVIDAAQDSAKVGPKPGAYVNAIQVYPFARGALYQVYTAPEQVTDIALQQGEALISVSSGDTERWILGDTLSGSGETEQVHILVKPVESGLSTNLVITTTKRTYHAELTSYRETYMAAVSWRYPREDFIQLSKSRPKAVQPVISNVRKSRDTLAHTPAGLSIDQLNFRYRLEGDDPHWRPLQAFDDGQKVYIQFPARLDQGEAPPLFVVGDEGDTQLVNYRVKGRYYIVDRLFARAELRLGEKDQQVVQIKRVTS